MADNIFDLKAKLSLDSSQFSNGIKGAQGEAQGFASALAVGFAGAVATITAVAVAVAKVSDVFSESIQEVAEYGDSIDKNSQRLGMSTEAYQKWDYALNLAGTSMGECAIGVKTMTNQIDKAKGGSAEAITNFQKLGVSLDDLYNDDRETIFGKVIMGFQNMGDSTERAALANDIFGKSGQNLTPIFNMTSDELREAMVNTTKYGMVMSKDAVQASAKFVDSQTTLKASISGVKNNLLSQFLPALTKVNSGLTKIFSGVNVNEGKKELAEGMKDLVETIKAVAPDVIKAGIEIIKALADGLADGIEQITPIVGDIIYIITDILIQNMPVLVECAIQLAKAFAKALLVAIGSSIKAQKDSATDSLREVGNSLGVGFTDDICDAIDGSPIASAVVGEFNMLLNSAWYVQLGKMIGSEFTKATGSSISAGDIANKVVSAFQGMASPVSSIMGQIKGVVGQGFSNLADNARNNINQLAQEVSSSFNSIRSAVSQGVDSARNSIAGFASNAQQSFSNVVNAVTNVAHSVAYTLSSGVNGAIQGCISIFNSFASAVGSAMSSASSAFGSFTSALSSIVNGVNSVIQSVISAFNNLVNEVASIGTRVAQGFLQGFQNAWNSVVSAVQQGVENVKQMIEKLFNVHSPSRWAMQVGDYVGQGFNIGFNDSFGDISAVEGFINQVENYTKQGLDFGTMSASIAPQSVNVRNFSEQDNKVTVVIEGDASRMFRLMQAQSSKNAQLVGV